ncbi:MAG TPA: PEP-CTERM sorting domain-containing protein [Candidatus Limnocylindrales bacterium]|nr:PEP-CTERM sorting domain-containing protein [Candidatus Limnocylindrales bacterium]
MAALCLGSGTAAAVTLPAPVVQDVASIQAPSAGLSDAPPLEIALLGGETSEDNALFDAGMDATDEAAPAANAPLADFEFASEGDAYAVMASARGFESSGHGRGWGGSLLAVGATAAIIVAESGRHTAHGLKFGAPGTSHSPAIPSSTPSNPPSDVPEPGTFALLAAGMMISAAFRRRLRA